MSKEKIRLSASRVKVFDSCTWLYQCNYKLKLPQHTNDGARRGLIVHAICEHMLCERHAKKHFKSISTRGQLVSDNPVIKRFVEAYAKVVELEGQENLDMVYKMIWTALNQDFFIKGSVTLKPEWKFDIEQDKYRIYGFIDKRATFKDGSMKIVDYKTSKQKFVQKEIEYNVQALMYALACWKEFGQIPEVEFLFVKFDGEKDTPVVKVPKITEDTLSGFESYLEYLNEVLLNFNEESGKEDMAFHKGFPDKGEGFCKKLMCGFAKRPGQLKKDGSPMWHCSAKFPFDYYEIRDDETDRVIQTDFEKEKLPEPKEGQTLSKMHYTGCPAHNITAPKPKAEGYDPFDL
jgi:hypothetical protein